MALEAAYAFDGSGSTVLDLSGNGRDITLTGTNGVQVAGGQTGNALGKTGATMPVLPTAVLTASETDDRTVMLDVLGTNRAVWVIRWNDDGLGSGIWGVLALDGATMQSRARRQSDTAAAGALTFGTSQAGTWHNICLTYVRSTGVLTAYWDGVQVSSGVPSGWSAGQQLMTGADRIDLAEWSTTGPAIDNLRIYSHALNGTQVAALAGTPVTAGGVTGSGSVTAPTATTTGAGTVTASGSGSTTAAVPVAAGTGAVAVSGTGALTAPSSSVAGSGSVLVSGGGAATASASVAVGTAQGLIGGAGAAVVPPAVIAGSGGVLVSAMGELLASPPVIVGFGSAMTTITGSGSAVAAAAVVSGSDAVPAETPPERMFAVSPEVRVFTVPAETRMWEA